MQNVEFIYGIPSLAYFEDMFGGWLTEHEGHMFLVDCGVGSGAPSLVERLKARLAGRPLDYVLLTHIHLDHAGGLGEIVRAWPEVKILAHAKGLPHLISPERLWTGTLEVMGEQVGAMYGRPAPMEPARLISHTEADIPGLTVIETPGHAQHHLSFRLGRTLFAGEAAGCPDLVKGRLYLSPATPPRFFPEVTLASVDRLAAEAEPDDWAYCGHTPYPVPLAETLVIRKRQLAFWGELVSRPESARREGEAHRDHLSRLTDDILREDPDYVPAAELSPPALQRHRYFIGNNLEGFLGAYKPEARAAANAG